MDPVLKLLEETGLSAKYCLECAYHVTYVKNFTLNSSLDFTSYEALYGKKPNRRHIRIFGYLCLLYNHIPNLKLHANATPVIHFIRKENGVHQD